MSQPKQPSHPSPSGRNGRGRFVAGNRVGQGHPHKRKANQLRSALMRAVSPQDIVEIVDALVRQAKQGDVQAAREIFDRLLGKAPLTIDADVTAEVGGSIQIVYSDDWYGTKTTAAEAAERQHPN